MAIKLVENQRYIRAGPIKILTENQNSSGGSSSDGHEHNNKALLDKLNFAFSISHDGPGQNFRGPDPC